MINDELIDILEGKQNTVCKTKRALTEKQRAFVVAFCNPASVVYNNATQSMIKAGYAKKYAAKNIMDLKDNQGVKVAIQKYRAKIAAKMEITRALQESRLNTLYLMAIEQENVVAARGVVSELNDMAGFKRDKAPNPEALAGVRERMEHEEIKYRQEFTISRCKAEAEHDE